MKTYPTSVNTKPFFSSSQMAQLRKIAMSGMTTDIVIQRREYADDPYGDDEQVSYRSIVKTKGWLFSHVTPMQESDMGSLITANTYRLYIYVGTDIKVGDRVLANGDTYVVSDTTAESTWQALMVCSLRKRE